MLLYEFGSLYEIDLAICFNEVVTNGMNIIYYDELYIFLLNSLLKVEEDLVVIFNIFAEMHNDILSYGLLRHCRLVLNQKVLFHLIETFFV